MPLFRRRLLILGLIGCAHILLLWEGDILLLYAAIGFLLIPMREMATRRLLRWVLGLLGVPLLLVGLAFAGLLLVRQFPEPAARLSVAEAEFSDAFADTRADVIERYANDDLLADAFRRLSTYVERLPLLLVRAPGVLAMFLLGFVVGRQGILRDIERYTPLLRRACGWGLGLGLGLSLFVTLAYSQLAPFAALTVLGFNQVLAGPLLAVGYGAAFVLIAQHQPWQRLLAPLAPYGRMALTMYLLQTALCGLLFYGAGFGLVLDIPPYQYLPLALVLNLLLIGVAILWLRRFRYGPIEWIWRSLTLKKVQPFLAPRPTSPTHQPQPAATGSRIDDRHRDRSFDGPQAPEQQ